MIPVAQAIRHTQTSVPDQIDRNIAPSIRVEVSDFGPIASGAVDLRPLSVFVGPSNSGKTYLAVLLYALSESLGGFPRCPGPRDFRTLTSAIRASGGGTDEEWMTLADKLTTSAGSIRFDDLPERIQIRARAALQEVITDPAGLSLELNRCFDTDRITELVRCQADVASNARISVSASDGDQRLWWFELGIPDRTTAQQDIPQSVARAQDSNHSIAALDFRGKLEDPHLMLPKLGTVEGDIFSDIRNWVATASNEENRENIYEAIEHILMCNNAGGKAHYLPAARSGIIQSQRVIASSLFLRTTRAGLERLPRLPTFSGMVADFMEKLVLNDDHSRGYRFRLLRNSHAQLQLSGLEDLGRESVANIAADLERKLLNGSIQARDESRKTYPDFVYVPNQSNLRLQMSQSSSMVSELAPIILFLREIVAPSDMIIIEEPEAHLHPAIQTQMALALAKLARTGVRVIITTHSDWLLKQIGNIIRQGEVGTASSGADDSEFESSSLSEKDVGVWLFEKDHPTSGSTIREIPYDRIDGITPTEFARVDEELYNRSADLQNILEHREKGGLSNED